MSPMLQQMWKQSKGFTLVELLVAVALLAVILAVVIPNVTGYLSK